MYLEDFHFYTTEQQAEDVHELYIVTNNQFCCYISCPYLGGHQQKLVSLNLIKNKMLIKNKKKKPAIIQQSMGDN